MNNPLCVIVGAGEGLGKSLATKFAREGLDLALISRTEAGSRAAMEAATAANGNVAVKHYAADVMAPESLEEALGRASEDLGPVDVMIYNVRNRFTACAPLDLSYDDLMDEFRLEVIGALAAAKAVIPTMQRRGSGTLLYSSATAAFRGSATYPHYAIGKFGLRALSQSLAKAHAADGIHVAHVRLDCDLDVPIMQALYGEKYDPDALADPADVAETYWWLTQQPKGAWSNEVDLRPHTERWTF